MAPRRSLLAALGMTLVWSAVAPAQQREFDQLVAADRAFSAAAAKTDVVSGLTPMLSAKVIMPTPGTFADGIAAATDYLRSIPTSASSRVEWTPVGGGISADGQHGFTYGFMTQHNADGTETPLKYLSYWIKEDGAWKVAAYKRSRRPPGRVSMTVKSLLPSRMLAPSAEVEAVAAFGKSLSEAEQAFSDEAAVIGLGPAFEKFGSPDAMNIGRDADFTFGNVDIARSVGGSNPTEPSRLVWKSDHTVMVASSGDLGVSIGFIHQKNEPNAAPFPFFTVWRRENPTAPWRYVAE